MMFRIWGKIFHENRLVQDMVYENDNPSDFLEIHVIEE